MGESDKSERDFLTTDESGKEVKATWNGPPPTHETYLNDQRILRERSKNKEKSHRTGHKSVQEPEIHDQKTPTMKTPAELAPGRKPKLQASENRQRKPLKNLGELPVDLLDPDLRKNTVKPKREKPTVKPTAKKTKSNTLPQQWWAAPGTYLCSLTF